MFRRKRMSELINRLRMRSWAEINLDNIEYNYSLIRKRLDGKTKICCIIKADGYGHGALKVAKLFENLGADYLGVSNIEEALQLRQNAISLPILILGYTPPECAKILSDQNIEQCVYSLEYGSKLASEAKNQGVRVKIHIKLDTGMGRIGFLCNNERCELPSALEICKNENLVPKGLFTHFAAADQREGSKEYTNEQYKRFDLAKDYFASNGISFDLYHCANSSATFEYPEFCCDMVRVGIVLYGLCAEQDPTVIPSLKPAMRLCSIISHIKTVEKGEAISYGRTFIADKRMKVATVPIGYADGLCRASSENGYTLQVHGKKAKILARFGLIPVGI